MRHAVAFAVGLASIALFAAPERPARGLLGYWDFAEVIGGISPDRSPAARDAELQGATPVQGPFGKALAFNGKGASVVLPEIPELNGSDELTVSCWVLWQGTGQYPNILTGGAWSPGGFMIFVRNDSCTFRMGRPGHKAGRAGDQWREISANLVPHIVQGRWYHLAAVFKRPEIVTYVDGKRVGGAHWDYPVGHEGDIRLGVWAGKASHNGLIDEVKIFKRALSAEEVQAEFAATETGRNPGGQSPAWQPVADDRSKVPVVATYRTEASELAVDKLGRIASLRTLPDGKELIDVPLPLVVLTSDRRRLMGRRCRQEGDELVVTLRRDGGEVHLRVIPRKRHFRLELTKVPDGTTLTFCQISPTTVRDQGTMAGLLADETHGVCMRALNLDTNVQLVRGRNTLAATTYDEYGLDHGAIAIVASTRAELRPILKEVVEAEKMPKSELGGPWSMDAEANRGSYLFAEVSEANVDDWIDLARRGGFADVHMHGWWTSLGHYAPRKSRFPDGMASLKRTVDRIHAAGLQAGIHTLSGCVATNDPWVTPVPDPRLYANATYTLAKDLGPKDTEIHLKEPFGNYDIVWSYSGNGNVVRIGEELIHYTEISQDRLSLRKCIRGAFKTRPSTHAAGATVGHLLQRYLAFYPDQNSTLVGELADCIADAYNTCKMDEIYFDGSEGMGGWRAIAVMRNAIYDRLKPPALTEASCWGHHNWWFHSRLGAWDHPKWAPKRFTDMHIASAEEHRRRDLLEPQLGWWALTGPSSISRGMYPDEVEYFVGKTMSIDAPMSIQGVNVGSRPPNARQNEYFTLIGWYEDLRLARYFTPETCQSLRQPGSQFRLRQDAAGVWQFRPLATLKHRATPMPATWTVQNPYAEQPLRIRLEALYAVEPYDSPQQVTVADFEDLESFDNRRHAAGVTLEAGLDSEQAKVGPHSLRLVATNTNAERTDSWAQLGTHFRPYRDIRPGEAIGLWVHGDGKGAILNIQFENPREYTHCIAEHYIDLDFVGWKYVEIPFRERSADRYHDYQWPYFSQHGIFRNRLQTNVVSSLNLYVNNIPKGERTEILVSPIRALPIRPVPLRGLSLVVNGSAVSLPDIASSGGYLEVDETAAGTVRDARGEILSTFALPPNWPKLRSGENTLQVTAQTTAGYNARAEVTVFALGEPFGKRNAPDQVDWTRLRREYTRPRTVGGKEPTVWDIAVRPEAKNAQLELDLELAGSIGNPAFHNRPENLLVEPCDDPALFELSQANTYAKYAYDATNKGIPAKPGVTHELTVVTDDTKTGKALRYTATSTRADNGGWAAKGRKFSPPLDLSGAKGLGFWLRGDGKGESFKVQLRDTKGMWHDMVTRINFTGWRYVSFAWDSLRLDPSHVEYVIFYFNGIPGGATVSCTVDDLRALRSTVRLPNPTVEINGTPVRLPVTLASGEHLRLSANSCQLRQPGKTETIPLTQALPELHPGTNRIRLLLDLPEGASARTSVTKVYR
jgi:hypothetical protein